jgi:hypothetical protein
MPLSADDLAFLALTDDELRQKSETRSFDIVVFQTRMNTGENWVRLIQAHLYFDHVLTAMLVEALMNADAINASRMGFAQKAQLINAMGLLPQELISPIEFINSLRNKIAHQLDFSISEQDIKDLANCVPRDLRDTMVDFEGLSAAEPLGLHHLLVVVLLNVEVARQRHAYQRLVYRQAALRLRKALDDAAPTLKDIKARQSTGDS